METNELILKFEEKETTYNFGDKINKIEDKKLIKYLGRENVKNSNSTLIIKSMNIPIYDVIQFKINVSEVGSFLFNFKKETMNDKVREEILSKISNLHDNVEPTKETQINKIKNLIKIISEYEEIYCSYIPNGKYKMSFEELNEHAKDIDFSFPILFLANETKDIFESNNKIGYRKFSFDYLFTTIFAVLMSFGILTGIFQIFNKESVAAFLLVLTFIFFGILSYCIYSIIYKNFKEPKPSLKYFLLIYVIAGIIVGIAIGWLICKYVLNTEITDFNYANLLLISTGVSIAAAIGSIYLPKFINFVIQKI